MKKFGNHCLRKSSRR